MTRERYEFLIYEPFTFFEFYSEGPHGLVKKVVEFIPTYADGLTFVNLSFGDWDEKKKRINDLAVTRNKDGKKILATVAAIVLKFIETFPDMYVYAQGSTPARTRLYQISIVENWKEIDKLLYVYGYLNNRWQRFRKNVNYNAFMVSKK